MLLTEDILLLATDDTSGRRLARYTDLLVAVASLSDLALAGNVRTTEPGEPAWKNRVVAVLDAAWPADLLLAEALTGISRGRTGTCPRWSNGWATNWSITRLSTWSTTGWPRPSLVSRTPHRVPAWCRPPAG